MSDQPSELSTRQRILAYLAEHHSVSAPILSRTWGLTPADIRYHLNGLFHDGLIDRIPNSIGSASRTGRPEQYYRLSAAAAPNNLAVLCGALLSILLANGIEGGETEANRLLQAAATSLKSTLTPAQASAAPTSAVTRLSQAIEALNRWNYRARWEAGKSGPRLLLHRCPYAAIVNDHPEICIIDRLLLEKLTGISLQQTARMNLVTGKPPACVFTAGSQPPAHPLSMP